MRRYIILAAAVMTAMTACGKKEQPPAAPAAQTQTEAATEPTTAEIPDDIPSEVTPDITDVRTYCVSLDAARNELIANYSDKIPAELKENFDSNSGVLDEIMNKAAGDLNDEEIKKLFGQLQGLETYFCKTMAEAVGAGDAIEEIAVAATKNSDYYFEKFSEETTEENTEETTEESEEDAEETTEEDDKKDN